MNTFFCQLQVNYNHMKDIDKEAKNVVNAIYLTGGTTVFDYKKYVCSLWVQTTDN